MMDRRWAGAFIFIVILAAAAPAWAVDAQYQNRMRHADRHLDRGNAEIASKLYEQVLAKHPFDLRASRGYARSLIVTERLEEAETFLDEALGQVQEPGDLLRVRVLLRRAQKNPAEAFEDVLRVMESKPELASWTYREAVDLVEVEGLDLEAASRTTKDRVVKDEPSVPLQVMISLLTALNGEGEKALRSMLDADRKHDWKGRGLLQYSEEMLGLGRDSEALEGMLATVERTDKPSVRSQILFKIADLQERQAKFEDALVSLEQITLEREGTTTAGRALLKSAEIYQTYLDDPQGALNVYERLRDDPLVGHHRSSMLFQMAECYVRLGRFEAAEKTYREVFPEALDPEQTEKASLRIADVAFYSGNSDSALTLYQDMAENNPRSLFADDAADRYIMLNKYQSLGGGEAMSWFGRMEWARWIGDSTEVEQSAGKILDFYPASEIAAESILALAQMAEKGGNLGRTFTLLDRLLADFGTDRRVASALMWQGRLLNDQGRVQEALLRYESVLTDHSDSVQAGEARRLVEKLRRELKS